MLEVRRQFREHPGIMEGTEKPEYGRVVDIVTRDSLRELTTPGLMAVLTPVAVGFGLGVAPLGAFLGGVIVSGQLLAVMLSNAGGAWDNAKKTDRGGRVRRQGFGGAQGRRHRRHGRRPVQGHGRPGAQPAHQGDEPRRAAHRRAGRRIRRRADDPGGRSGSRDARHRHRDRDLEAARRVATATACTAPAPRPSGRSDVTPAAPRRRREARRGTADRRSAGRLRRRRAGDCSRQIVIR